MDNVTAGQARKVHSTILRCSKRQDILSEGAPSPFYICMHHLHPESYDFENEQCRLDPSKLRVLSFNEIYAGVGINLEKVVVEDWNTGGIWRVVLTQADG